MSEKKSVIFELTEPLEYTNTKKGGKEETLEIEMFAPSYDTAKLTYKLSQYFMKAIMSSRRDMSIEEMERIEESEKKKKNEGVENMGIQELKMILLASDISLDKVMESFIVFSKKVCFLDDDKKIPLTNTLIGKMSWNDVNNMVFTYIVNFIVPFALSTN